ncbi:MAG TPA: DUF1054 domain-containing protein [Bacillales bacterium]
MSFKGFTKKDFETFSIDGLDERMEAIQERIQPKFQAIGEELAEDLSGMLGNEMFLHIARHARRTKNPPESTWLALAENKRGYKKHPHFQVGLFDDHAFIWLAFINELEDKREIGQKFLSNIREIESIIPDDFVVSLDHTKNQSYAMEEIDLKESLERFRDVKKSEFLVGRHIKLDDPNLKDGRKFLDIAQNTFETVIPIYKMA